MKISQCPENSTTPLTRAIRYLPGIVVALAVVMATLFVPAAVRAEEPVHSVGHGESLGFIAQQYNVSVQELIQHNSLGNPDLLVAGQQLRIPIAVDETAVDMSDADSAGDEAEDVATDATIAAESSELPALAPAGATLPGEAGYHIVSPGDTASVIAQTYGLDMDGLLRLNFLENPNLISTGQQLRVTARVPALAIEDDLDSRRTATNIHTVGAGESLTDIAEEYGTTVRDLMRANGLPNENFIHPGQRLRVYASAIPAFNSIATNNGNGRKWIEVDLSTQTLTAWQGDVPVMYSTISSGKQGTPTVTGRFQVGTKYTSQRMYGPGYDIPGVPWVMYFFADYAIHGAYWHNAFGTPTSHGCVNMRPAEAEALWNWAPPGTEVWVHH